MKLIKDVLTKLSDSLGDNEIFLSEADLQFSFAYELANMNLSDDKEYKDKIDNIILEYPIMTSNLYKHEICKETIKNCCKNDKLCGKCNNESSEVSKTEFYKAIEKYNYEDYEKNDYKELTKLYNECESLKDKYNSIRTFIDLAFDYNDTRYFIEFKYKLNKIEKSVVRHGQKFNLRLQGATDMGRHSIYEDIERMENIKFIDILKEKKINTVKSFVIFITNHDDYWNINQVEGKLAHYMPLATCCSDDKMNIDKISKGIHPYQRIKKNKNDKSEYRRTIYLKNDYLLHPKILEILEINTNIKVNSGWYKFKKLGDGKNESFNCLLIDLNIDE